MPEIKLSKRYKCASDIMPKLLEVGFDFYTASDFLNSIADAAVVPKSEVETLKDLNDQLECDIVNANMNLDHMTKEVERLTVELKAMRGAANSLKMHYEKAKTELASEIFAEIEKEIDLKLSVTKEFLYKKGGRTAGKTIIQTRFNVLDELDKYFSELKKKYTENIPSPAPEEKYFSPQQVREMSPQELHYNFEAVKKSMDKWN